jgi:hypothetical protein
MAEQKTQQDKKKPPPKGEIKPKTNELQDKDLQKAAGGVQKVRE